MPGIAMIELHKHIGQRLTFLGVLDPTFGSKRRLPLVQHAPGKEGYRLGLQHHLASNCPQNLNEGVEQTYDYLCWQSLIPSH